MQQQFVRKAENLIKTDIGSVKTGWIVYRWIATLDDGRDTCTENTSHAFEIWYATLPDWVEYGVGIGRLLQNVGNIF